MRHGRLEDDVFGPEIVCKGQNHIEAAWDAKTPAARANRARKALAADLDNIDAYILLSHNAASIGERLALLQEAVRVGDRLWAPLIDDPEMHWWGFMGTRPYMRAMHELGLALEEAGDFAEAGAMYRRLLDLNPNDNQGVRALLTRLLMMAGRIGDLRALLKVYDDDYQLELMMAEFWLAMRSKKADMARLCPPIEKRNAHVLRWLGGRGGKRSAVERSPYGVTMGGEDEALMYFDEFGAIWDRTPDKIAKIRAWLDRKGAKS